MLLEFFPVKINSKLEDCSCKTKYAVPITMVIVRVPCLKTPTSEEEKEEEEESLGWMKKEEIVDCHHRLASVLNPPLICLICPQLTRATAIQRHTPSCVFYFLHDNFQNDRPNEVDDMAVDSGKNKYQLT